jgi:uncharacterized membrane protein YobD (UPF0266 family)
MWINDDDDDDDECRYEFWGCVIPCFALQYQACYLSNWVVKTHALFSGNAGLRSHPIDWLMFCITSDDTMVMARRGQRVIWGTLKRKGKIVEVWVLALVTLVLYGSEWSHSCHSSFSLGERALSTLWVEAWWATQPIWTVYKRENLVFVYKIQWQFVSSSVRSVLSILTSYPRQSPSNYL